MICHAAGESGPARPGTYAVILAVPNEQSLMRLASVLGDRGVGHLLIREPDAPWNGQAMAIGLPPGKRCKALSNLPLYKGPENDVR